MSQVTTSKQFVSLDELTRLVGAPVTLVSGVINDTNPKTLSAPVEQTVLQNAVNEYKYEPGSRNPHDAEDQLAAFIERAPNVIAGTDTFVATDIQTILGWMLVAFQGAQVAGPPAPGSVDPNPSGYAY
jgi:hypothetical protein